MMIMRRLAGSIVAGYLPCGSALNRLAPSLSHEYELINHNVLPCDETVTGPFPRVPSTAVDAISACVATVSSGWSPDRSFGSIWSRQLSTATREAARPLLNFRPSSGAAPLPSTDTCPTLQALDAHIQQHGHKYLLRHVAAGLCTLSSLAPLNAAGDAAAPRNTALAPADTVGSSDGGFAAASDLPSGLPHPAAAETTRPGPGDGGGGARPPSPVASAPSTALVADCARRLALIGRHQVKTETDCASLALCIRGLAGLDLPLPDRAQLALPFVMRLRDPAYFFALRGQPAATLVQLLAALSKLPLYRHVQRSDVARIAQVSARLVASLTPQVALLSSQDACRVTAALVRLGCSPERREAELYRDFMRALAGHISQVLLEEGRLTPDQAVRLLWAYAVVAPPSGGAAAASGGATGLQPTAAPAPAPLGDSARKGAAAAAAAAVTAAAGGEEDVVVRQMVVALLRMACRGLDSHPPLELVKLVFALPRLGVQREADAVLPRVTPRLLAKLESLDLEALADVASSYHRAHSHEPGLLQAIADRVLELEKGSPLSSSSRRVIGQLLACYGPGGSHVDQRLRELLQRTSAQRPAAPGAAALAAAGPSGGGRSLSRRLGVGP